MIPPETGLPFAIQRGEILLQDRVAFIEDLDARYRRQVVTRVNEIAEAKRRAAVLQSEEANRAVEDLVGRWSIDICNRRWDAIQRLLVSGRLAALGRVRNGSPRIRIADAAWDRAAPYGGELRDLGFGNGAEWFDVVLVEGTSRLNAVVPSDCSEVGAGKISMRPAGAAAVRDALRKVYRTALDQGEKPPNLNEVVDPVKTTLASNGYSASKGQIQEVAAEEEFRSLRRKPGARARRTAAD